MVSLQKNVKCVVNHCLTLSRRTSLSTIKKRAVVVIVTVIITEIEKTFIKSIYLIFRTFSFYGLFFFWYLSLPNILFLIVFFKLRLSPFLPLAPYPLLPSRPTHSTVVKNWLFSKISNVISFVTVFQDPRTIYIHKVWFYFRNCFKK
jgi:hypothetical protein